MTGNMMVAINGTMTLMITTIPMTGQTMLTITLAHLTLPTGLMMEMVDIGNLLDGIMMMKETCRITTISGMMKPLLFTMTGTMIMIIPMTTLTIPHMTMT